MYSLEFPEQLGVLRGKQKESRCGWLEKGIDTGSQRFPGSEA
jgi:hypothetical protein